MELRDRDRAFRSACGGESLRGRAGAGRDRPHRASRRQDQRDLRSRFRTRSGGCPRGRHRTRAGRDKAVARHSPDGKGILQRRGAAHDLGLSAAEGFCPTRRRAVDIPRQGCGRRDHRQDQCAGRAS